MKLSIIGPPGCGKGIQSELLSKKFKLKHISPGDILRNLADKKTKLGLKIEKIIDKGNLVPDKIILKIIKDNIKKDNFILDGFPRDLSEARALEKITKLSHVILINVTKKTIVKRLKNRVVCRCGMVYNLKTKKPKIDLLCDKCGKKLYHRDDDRLRAIEERLRVYNKKTIPVINYYKNKNLLREVNGEQEINRVFKNIAKILINYQ